MSEPTQVVTRASAAVLDALNNPRLSLLKNILLVVFLHQAARQAYRLVFVRGVSASWQQFSKELIKWSIKIIRATVPGVDAKIKKEIEKAVKSIESKNAPDVPGEVKYLTLPTEGLTDGVLRGELRRYKGLESDEWKSGKISGAIYHSVESLNQLTTETYGMFGLANPLHPEVFPSVRKMEAEVIAMVLNMHHAPAEACGSVTSGGTESLLMAVKTYRDMARELRGVTEPEMVVPVTIHVAFDKAAQYFGVRIIHIPVDPVTFQVDVRKMDRAINRNTIMIAGSTPNYPYGTMDDIPALGRLAEKHKVPFHVDNCLGSFLTTHLEKAGLPVPYLIDFRVPQVTSISCDTHKYGFAPKGTSVLMYRSKEIRNYQYFFQTEWPGGIYASPSTAGSRAGSLIACCWTTLLSLGERGYIEATKQIVGNAHKIADGIRSIPLLQVMGTPYSSVVAFQSADDTKLSIYGVADLLSKRGWHLTVLQFPKAIHIACTLLTTDETVATLLKDIREVIDILEKNPEAGNGEIAAIYGSAATVPDRTVVSDICKGFLDSLTKA